ncbi:MAG: alpha-L-arabinofuranosidase C-terminal domain-containing protein [Lacibacter sp.]
MQKIVLSVFLAAMCFTKNVVAGNPDSVYLFSYATVKNANHNGLHFAWSRDKENWFTIGNEYSFVRCDYGRWGSEKRMITPYLLQGQSGDWQMIWSLNEKEARFAHVSSPDLLYWDRQVYPQVSAGVNVMNPVLQYDAHAGQYNITYADKSNQYYRVTTNDFKLFGPAVKVAASGYHDLSVTVLLPNGEARGQVHKVAWAVVDKIIKGYEAVQYKNSLYAETTMQDSIRFATLKPVDVSITLQPQKSKPISDMLVGVFFEDINYAADGGLYAELIQNRDFEYALSDKEGRDQQWNSTHSWMLKGEQTKFTIDNANPVHYNNQHYAVLETTNPGAVLINTGFDGIVVKKGEKYNFSLFSKKLNGKADKLQARLVTKSGTELAKAIISINSSQWKISTATFTAAADATDAQLELKPLSAGTIALDMISLFPQKTFKGRKNGLRADLAQTIADIHPRFIRFPGGCVAHGDGIGNIYRWKNTIGPLESRKPLRNLWGYHQTTGLGYFEYFQYCEDIGAAPLPVIAAAVPCQNSATGGGGQQGGIPMAEMDEYIQDIFDLIEWANGSVNTKWGKLRAEAGHPKPFNLKYIGIGNEDLISDVFEERFTMIYRAIKEKHPEITVIGTVGPAAEGTDYEEGWGIATKLQVPMVDEHYYQSPGWFIHNQDYYDKYDRSKSKVYLGEYAAHLPGRPNNLETALAEALYLTALERNGDVVSLASYAPLLAKEGHTQWNPNMIYFNNKEVKTTAGYYVQQLFGLNSGSEYVQAVMQVANQQDAVRKRIAYSVVKDAVTGDVIIKLVNLLPVTVKVNVDAGNLFIAGSQATKTVLTGKPADKTVRPVETIYTATDHPETELLPYSFTVIRMKAAKEQAQTVK